MSRGAVYALGAALIAAALGAGVYFGYAWRIGPPEAAGSAALLQTRFTSLSGDPVQLQQWEGKRLVVNFWATWCAPCREEMPLLNAGHAEYAAKGVEFVGIALDQPAAVQEFIQQLGIQYPIVIGGAEVLELTRRLGNKAGGLPFTVLVEPDGRISRTLLGQIHAEDLREWLGAPQGAGA